MSETNPWANQWFKAQQQFVDAWGDMAESGSSSGQKSQADLWAQSFDLWRKASGGQTQPDVMQAINKCVDMGREYFTMAEQVTKGMSAGASTVDAVNQWMEQLKQSLQPFGAMPGLNGGGANDFMKQWFSPAQSWQQMATTMMPMNHAAWQMPGLSTPSFNMGEAIDPMGKILSSPGIGYFREPQEKQQKGIQLALEYQEANNAFNQAFMKVSLESIQDYQSRLLKMDADKTPKTLRQLYDLWVEISEEHYAVFAMSEEYQTLYGDMVNRLMILKKHYAQITDDTLRAMNLPNTTEVDTMQQRLHQLRRDNIVLKKEMAEIKAMLQQATAAASAPEAAKPATKASTPAPKAAKPAPKASAPAPKASAQPAPSSKKAAPKKVAVKPATRKAAVKKAAAPKTAKPKAAAKKAPVKKKSAVTKATKGA